MTQRQEADGPLVLEQVYDAPIAVVWQAITDKDAMKEWYFPQLTKFEPVVGFDFGFAEHGSNYKKEWRVTQVIEGRRLAHSWIYEGYPGNSEVIFDLSQEGNGTRLKLTHTGLASFPQDEHFARRRFEDGWNRILGLDLKRHLEK